MAFTGTATVNSLGKYIAHINNISLGIGAQGTIGVAGTGADVTLPANFPTAADPQASAAGLGMDLLVEVRIQQHSIAGNESTHLHFDVTLNPGYLCIISNDEPGKVTGACTSTCSTTTRASGREGGTPHKDEGPRAPFNAGPF